jgi:hypothetical protein
MQQDSPRKAKTGGVSSMLKWNRRKGKEATNMMEEFDESVYFLTLNHDKWEWSKPIVHGNRAVTMHVFAPYVYGQSIRLSDSSGVRRISHLPERITPPSSRALTR